MYNESACPPHIYNEWLRVWGVQTSCGGRVVVHDVDSHHALLWTMEKHTTGWLDLIIGH